MMDTSMSKYASKLELEYRRDGKYEHRVTITRHMDLCGDIYWRLQSNDNLSDGFDEPLEADSLYDALALARELIEAAHGTTM